MSQWAEHAACKGATHLFFSDLTSERNEARRICHTCPVFDECFHETIDLANKRDLWGIWAATSREQRRRMVNRKQRPWISYD